MKSKKSDKSLTLEEKLEQALVPVDEQPYEIPSNWVWVKIGNITTIIGGGTPSSKCKEYFENGDIPWICPADLSHFNGIYINHGARNITKLGLEKSSARLMPAETVCLSTRAPIGYVAIAENELCTNQGFKSFLPSKSFISKYLYWFLKGNKDLLESRASGTTFLELSTTRVSDIEFPLPPLPEQQRIVDLIERLFAKLDEAKEKVQTAIDSFELRKASILHKAFTGELTRRWREEKEQRAESEGDCLTNGSQCSEQSLRARNELEQRAGEQKSRIAEGGEALETAEGLPCGWERKSIASICKSLKYGTSKKSEKSGKVVVLRMGNLQNGEIDWTDLAYTNDVEDIEKYKLQKGDVLFNRTNSAVLVGKTSIYRGEFPAIYAGYLIKLDYDHSIISGEFLNYALNTLEAKHYCNSVKTDGVNQSNINAQKIGAYQIPLPPLAEQKEIVRILDSMLAKSDKAKELAEDALENIETLKKTILAKAFRGLLGTNRAEEASSVELLKQVL